MPARDALKAAIQFSLLADPFQGSIKAYGKTEFNEELTNGVVGGDQCLTAKMERPSTIIAGNPGQRAVRPPSVSSVRKGSETPSVKKSDRAAMSKTMKATVPELLVESTFDTRGIQQIKRRFNLGKCRAFVKWMPDIRKYCGTKPLTSEIWARMRQLYAEEVENIESGDLETPLREAPNLQDVERDLAKLWREADSRQRPPGLAELQMTVRFANLTEKEVEDLREVVKDVSDVRSRDRNRFRAIKLAIGEAGALYAMTSLEIDRISHDTLSYVATMQSAPVESVKAAVKKRLGRLSCETALREVLMNAPELQHLNQLQEFKAKWLKGPAKEGWLPKDTKNLRFEPTMAASRLPSVSRHGLLETALSREGPPPVPAGSVDFNLKFKSAENESMKEPPVHILDNRNNEESNDTWWNPPQNSSSYQTSQDQPKLSTLVVSSSSHVPAGSVDFHPKFKAAESYQTCQDQPKLSTLVVSSSSHVPAESVDLNPSQVTISK